LRSLRRTKSRSQLILCFFLSLTINCITERDSIAQSNAASSVAKQSATSKSKDFGATGNATPSTLESNSKAMQYFEAKQYEKAADAFDIVLQTSAPARLTYYAALSNQSAGRMPRATALFQFVVT
jgi:hypothetical protein